MLKLKNTIAWYRVIYFCHCSPEGFSHLVVNSGVHFYWTLCKKAWDTSLLLAWRLSCERSWRVRILRLLCGKKYLERREQLCMEVCFLNFASSLYNIFIVFLWNSLFLEILSTNRKFWTYVILTSSLFLVDFRFSQINAI